MTVVKGALVLVIRYRQQLLCYLPICTVSIRAVQKAEEKFLVCTTEKRGAINSVLLRQERERERETQTQTHTTRKRQRPSLPSARVSSKDPFKQTLSP
eukprot:1735329-Rhodomonas_salina.1